MNNRAKDRLKAAPEEQLRLLDLQQLDSTLDRLAHRRRTLPELAQISELEARIARLADDSVLIETEDSDLGREQSKLEGDIDVVRTRMQKDQQRLDTGQVSSPRELENLQSEIESLKRRQGELEDEELEIMERREAVQRRLAEVKDERATLAVQLSESEQRRDEAFAEMDAESEKTTQQRSETATSIPSDLLELYEKLRGSSGGVGAAALHRGRCEGCHLQLNTTDLNRLREAPEDDVLRCEECRRILVRTAESGL
jgi:predicted  nucleic acid-binding Zn-ribbon protein